MHVYFSPFFGFSFYLTSKKETQNRLNKSLLLSFSFKYVHISINMEYINHKKWLFWGEGQTIHSRLNGNVGMLKTKYFIKQHGRLLYYHMQKASCTSKFMLLVKKMCSLLCICCIGEKITLKQ